MYVLKRARRTDRNGRGRNRIYIAVCFSPQLFLFIGNEYLTFVLASFRALVG